MGTGLLGLRNPGQQMGGGVDRGGEGSCAQDSTVTIRVLLHQQEQ